MVNLCRSQTLAIIVPPVEPSPKRRRKSTKCRYRHHNVESLSGLCRARELPHQVVDSMTELGFVDFTGFECPLQDQHPLNYPKASGENNDFRRIEQDLSILCDNGLQNRADFWHTTSGPSLRPPIERYA